jgi:hypothetical protein
MVCTLILKGFLNLKIITYFASVSIVQAWHFDEFYKSEKKFNLK